MPSPREKLDFEWPYENPLGNRICPLCLCLVQNEDVQYHKEYHIKLLNRLEEIDEEINRRKRK